MGILRRKGTVACAEGNTPSTMLDSPSKPSAATGPAASSNPLPKNDSSFNESTECNTAGNFKAIWKEYCIATPIHGVRYFVEEGRTRFERVFWVLSLALSLACCFYLIMKVYTKWDNSPVIVSFAETSTPIWQVPFPAVTVCSETKVRQSVFNFTDVYKRYKRRIESLSANSSFDNTTNISEKESTYIMAVSLLCDWTYASNGNITISEEDLAILREVAPPKKDLFYLCNWHGEFDLCRQSTTFRPFMSDEGLCYTFNMLSNKELFTTAAVQHDEDPGSPSSDGWNLEKGYPRDASLETFPKRALGNGVKSGLHIYLNAYDDYDYVCHGPSEGFKVLLHNPAEVPQISQEYFHVPLNQKVVATVKPSMMTTSDGLREYEPSRRQCYFPYERHLRYFKVYTQKNCELECSTNYTMKMCSCAAFYMPRSADMPVCSCSACFKNAAASFGASQIKKALGRETGRESVDDCDCLPACTSLEYDAQTSQADFDWEKLMQDLEFNLDEVGNGTGQRKYAFVSIHFKDMQFITSQRSELYGPTDFLANCGGLLGLFSGFSFITLIEIVYYLSIRLWCNVHRAHQQRSQSLSQLANLSGLALSAPFDVEKQEQPQPSDIVQEKF